MPEEGLSFQMKASLSLGDVDQEEMLRAVGYDFEHPGRERLFVHDTAGFDVFSFPFQEPGKKRLAYNDVAHFVHSQYGSRATSNRADSIQNLLFEKLLGMAALYTDEGNPLCFNRRPSYQARLLQRVNV